MKQSFFMLSLLFVSAVHAVEEKVASEVVANKKAVVAKVGVVDFQKIIDMEDPANSASLEWRDIMMDLEKKLKPRMNKIQDMQTKLQKDAKEMREIGRPDDDTMARLQKLENDIQIDAKAYQSYSQKLLGEAQTQFGDKV